MRMCPLVCLSQVNLTSSGVAGVPLALYGGNVYIHPDAVRTIASRQDANAQHFSDVGTVSGMYHVAGTSDEVRAALWPEEA